jgi:hypothetical protein
LALSQLGAVAYVAVAAAVRLAAPDSDKAGGGAGSSRSSSSGAGAGAVAAAAAANPFLTPGGAGAYGSSSSSGGGGRFRGGGASAAGAAADLAVEFRDASVLVGNGSCLVGWLFATFCVHAASPDAGLRSVAAGLPLTLLLLLLRDDGGLWQGLNGHNRYAPPLLACQVCAPMKNQPAPREGRLMGVRA